MLSRLFIETLAILSAPLLYGLLCIPLTGLFLAQFPDSLNAQGGTHDTPLVLGVEALQFITLLICGAAVEWISSKSAVSHRALVVATVVMLAIAVSVQYQYWSALPTWHHFVFFALILIGMPMGGLALRKRRPAAR